mgnify:CR=1 FL=1
MTFGRLQSSSCAEEIISSVKWLKLLEETEKFQEWARRRSLETDGLFEGYKFLCENSFRVFVDGVARDLDVPLEEDKTLQRLLSDGKDITACPNTCEKIKFLRKAKNWRRKICKAESWNELEAILDRLNNSWTGKFDKTQKILDFNPELNSITKEEIINATCKKTAINSFAIKRSGVPRAIDKAHSLPRGVWEERLEVSLSGYSLGLQFLLENFSDNNSERFSEKLKQVENWSSRGKWSEEKKTHRELEVKSLEEIFPNYRKLYGLGGESWNFDSMTQLRYVFKEGELDKEAFNVFYEGAKEPELTEEQKLKAKLYWYDVEILEESKSNIFNGVPAFRSTLRGFKSLKRNSNREAEIFISKFKHPRKNGNDYSYGLLLESYGSIADYSGWLIFKNCANDDSGMGSNEHDKAEIEICRNIGKEEYYPSNPVGTNISSEERLEDPVKLGKTEDIANLQEMEIKSDQF